MTDPAGRRPPAAPQTYRHVFAALCRHPDAYARYAHKLPEDGELFAGVGAAYPLVWRALRKTAAATGRLPGQAVLAEAAADLATADGYDAFLGVDDKDQNPERLCEALFNRACDALAADPTLPDALAPKLQRLLEDQAIARAQLDLFDGASHPADPAAAARKLADELAAAGALVADGLPDLFAPGWDSEVVAVPEPTGLDVIDNGLGGGLLPGEVLMVLAAMGTGKTLLMVQLLVEQCRRAAAVELDTGRRFGVVFVSTEPTQAEVRDRAVICGAEIPRGRYEALPIKTMLCDRPAPGALPATRYELDRFKGRPFRPEKERAAEVADLLRKHLLYVDLTEHNPAMRGVAPTVDVAAVMAAEEVKRRKLAGVRFVLLDHVSAMATSLAMGARDPDKAEIGLIRSIPKLVRDRLGAVYGCPAVVTHQFSGEANGMSPYATLHHAQSRGSKMAAEFVDFALCVGVPALVDGQTVAQFQVTKPRRTGRKPPGVLRVDGEYGRLVDASGEWTCDPTARQFVPASARHASAPAVVAPGLSPVPAVPPGLDVS